MKKHGYLSISEFARISDIPRKTLIFYDDIGLFSPERIDENGFRLYSHRQIAPATVVNALRELDMPLKEIKESMRDLSPERCMELLERQREVVRRRAARLKDLGDMIEMRLEQIRAGIAQRDGAAPTLKFEERPRRTPFFFGEPFRYPKAEIPDSAMVAFFDSCELRGVPFGHALGYVVRLPDALCEEERRMASRLCFRLRAARRANAFLPSGLYATIHAVGDYGGADAVYPELLRFIEENGCAAAGDFVEEYLLDELTGENPKEYRLRISVRVERVSSRTSRTGFAASGRNARA